MLALSPARGDDFPDLVDHGDLLDIIDFDDLFGDVISDLEVNPEIITGEVSDHKNASSSTITRGGATMIPRGASAPDPPLTITTSESQGSKRDDNRKYSKSNNKQKRKLKKVDWTAELHRKFVEAVEELGVEKAVPSRILDLMGVHCLTRHNVASHLQKYRSHRKHLLAREAEAANWTRKRHTHRPINTNGWVAPSPTIGFPPPHVHHHHFRPLHVWGHPTFDHSIMPHVWPKHLPPPFLIFDSPYWRRIHNGTTPYLPEVATRFSAPPVAGIPQTLPPLHPVYKPDINGFSGVCPPVDLYPSKESVDAAIGDVLTRPWLPLPLGLKPPAVEGVMTELHRHGVSEVPPTAFCA